MVLASTAALVSVGLDFCCCLLSSHRCSAQGSRPGTKLDSRASIWRFPPSRAGSWAPLIGRGIRGLRDGPFLGDIALSIAALIAA